MNVLITGGAGFIGSHLADRLIARGDNVSVIDNLLTGRRENLPKDVKFYNKGVEEWCGYIFDSEKPDIVIHAAASYNDPDNWERDIMTNGVGTANIVRESLDYNVKRLIYFQTSLCYGIPKEQPIRITHPINPFSSYAISKTTGESYIANSELDYVSFRLANCYGERNLTGPIPTFYKRLTSGQKCFVVKSRRDFVYISDLVDIVMKAIDGEGNKGKYHISTGSDFSIKELFDNVCEALNIKVDAEIKERSKDDVATILLDPSKTLRDFNIKALSVPLKEGILRAVKWYQENTVGETYTHLRGLK